MSQKVLKIKKLNCGSQEINFKIMLRNEIVLGVQEAYEKLFHNL